MRGVLLALWTAAAGCGPERTLRERAVATPEGRVLDLELHARSGGGWAIAWRESAAPNGEDARAAFLLIGRDRLPESDVFRDVENVALGGSELVEAEGAILRVLIEQGEGSAFGLVMTVRESATGALRALGYRTLPIFAAGVITEAHLARTQSGALLVWVERTGAADLVQVASVDPAGDLVDLPRVLDDAPDRVARVALSPILRDGRVLVAVVGDGSVHSYLISEDGPFVPDVSQEVGLRVGSDDRALDTLVLGDDGFVLFTNGQSPLLATFDTVTGVLDPTLVALASPGEVALHPRLESIGGALVYVFDEPAGTSVARFLPGDEEIDYPLGPSRCSVVATLEGDPMPYACAAGCRALDCGDEWIYAGVADLSP